MPEGLNDTPSEVPPDAIVFITVLVDTSITFTVPEPSFATYANVPEGEKVTPVGLVPTVIVLIMVLVAGFITFTVPEPSFVT